MKTPEVDARQEKSDRGNAVDTGVHEAFEVVFDAVSRCLRRFQRLLVLVAAGTVQVPEELVVGIQDEYVALVNHRFLVGVDTPV